MEWNGLSFSVKNIKFFSFLAEFKRAEGRTIRYRYSCFNDFGIYDILYIDTHPYYKLNYKMENTTKFKKAYLVLPPEKNPR